MDGYLGWFLLLAVLPASFALRKVVPVLNQRWTGRWQLRRALESALPKPYYTLFHDLDVPTRSGVVRIDHLVLSPYGLFVIDAKPFSGRIQGSAEERSWTREGLRKTVRFDNPLDHNRDNIRALRNFLGLDDSKFHSIVVFTGETVLSPALPVNVTTPGGLLPFIQVRTESLLDLERLPALVERIGSSERLPEQRSMGEGLVAISPQSGTVGQLPDR
jgi:hypothetical protein